MVPSAIAIPQIQLAVLAGVFHPAAILGMLAAVVVVVAGGLGVAIAAQDRRQASPGTVRVVRLGSERDEAAAA